MYSVIRNSDNATVFQSLILKECNKYILDNTGVGAITKQDQFRLSSDLIPVKEVIFQKVEGYDYEMEPKSLGSIRELEKHIFKLNYNCHAYNNKVITSGKAQFTITWEDGSEYKGRVYIDADDAVTSISITDQMKGYIEYVLEKCGYAKEDMKEYARHLRDKVELNDTTYFAEVGVIQ